MLISTPCALAHLYVLLLLPALVFSPLSLFLFFSLSQWNLPAGVKTAGHLLAAAPVSQGDQRRECAH